MSNPSYRYFCGGPLNGHRRLARGGRLELVGPKASYAVRKLVKAVDLFNTDNGRFAVKRIMVAYVMMSEQDHPFGSIEEERPMIAELERHLDWRDWTIAREMDEHALRMEGLDVPESEVAS